jgi:hypothetical protein
MNHELDPRPERSPLELVVDGFVWTCCVVFALAVAFSYLGAM